MPQDMAIRNPAFRGPTSVLLLLPSTQLTLPTVGSAEERRLTERSRSPNLLLFTRIPTGKANVGIPTVRTV